MGATSIEWTDWSVNPIRARRRKNDGQGKTGRRSDQSPGSQGGKSGHYCEKISPGCAHCYASQFQPRFGLPQFAGEPQREERLAELELVLDPAVLRSVVRRKKPTRIFWCDMTDLFGQWVPDEWIAACFGIMALTPQHTHQVLTKRADRMAAWFYWIAATWETAGCPSEAEIDANLVYQFVSDDQAGEQVSRDDFPQRWPLPNVWLGVSAEDQQRADERIPHLLRTPAAVRWISAEPLLGAISLPQAGLEIRMPSLDLPAEVNIDWVVVGGESGAGARPIHPDWAHGLRDQCQAAGVPFFFKQWGAWLPMDEAGPWCEGRPETLLWPGKPDDPLTLPTTMFRVGKKAAGRLLDGREWNEFPEQVRANNA